MSATCPGQEFFDTGLNELKLKNAVYKVIDEHYRRKLRMENAGKSKKLEKFLKFKKFNIYFEYTTVDGSEFKGVVERAFETGYGRLLRYLNAGDSVFENLYVGHRVTETGLFLAVESDYLGLKTFMKPGNIMTQRYRRGGSGGL